MDLAASLFLDHRDRTMVSWPRACSRATFAGRRLTPSSHTMTWRWTPVGSPEVGEVTAHPDGYEPRNVEHADDDWEDRREVTLHRILRRSIPMADGEDSCDDSGGHRGRKEGDEETGGQAVDEGDHDQAPDRVREQGTVRGPAADAATGWRLPGPAAQLTVGLAIPPAARRYPSVGGWFIKSGQSVRTRQDGRRQGSCETVGRRRGLIEARGQGT